MLLEQDVDQIVPLFFFPEMVRDLAARSIASRRACIRPPARLRVYRSFWIKSRRRKKCLILHTPPATTTDPTHPTLAQSQLTVLRHVPTRA